MEISVNPEKRTVVAFGDGYFYNELHNMIEDLAADGNIYLNTMDMRSLIYSVWDGNPIIGKARCNPEDKFDEEEGKKLAIKRYKDKIKNTKIRVLKAYKKKLTKIMQQQDVRINAKINRYL